MRNSYRSPFVAGLLVSVTFCLVSTASLVDVAVADELTASQRVLLAGNSQEFSRLFSSSSGNENARQVIASVFDEFMNNRSAKTWLALEKIHDYADATLRKDFNYYAYQALEQEPLVYYLRYLNGDDNVIGLMRDALSYNPVGPGSQGRDSLAQVRATYETSKKQTLAHELSCRSKAGRRLEYFKAFNTSLNEWKRLTSTH